MKKRIGMNVEFAEAPAVGLALNYDGQRHELVGSGDRLTWRTTCLQCGDPFEHQTTLAVQHFTRNCVQHRANSFAQRRDNPVLNRDFGEGGE